MNSLFGLKELTIVRHGEAVQLQNIHNSELPLTVKGRTQAQKLGEFIKSQEFIAPDIYACSEFLRARETAKFMNLPDAKWTLDSYLVEGSRGELDSAAGKPSKHFLERYLGPDGWWGSIDGVERKVDVAIRAELAIRRYSDNFPMGSALVVAHGAFTWRLRFRIENWSIKEYSTLSADKNNEIKHCDMIQYKIENGNELFFRHIGLKEMEENHEIPNWIKVNESRLENSELV